MTRSTRVNPLYLETSALLRLVLNQDGAADVAGRISRASQVLASRLVRVEAERALLRMILDHPDRSRDLPAFQLRLAEVCSQMDFLEITREVCELAGRIAPGSRLRSLDSIHLATFEILRRLDPSAEILTYDDRLQAAL
jgi:predicted nucleic acid-binding protein